MTSFTVVLHCERCRRHADIVDISDRGARVRLEYGNFTKGEQVEMAVRGRYHPATIVWNKEGEAGLAFASPLPLDTLSTINRSMHRAGSPPKRRFIMP